MGRCDGGHSGASESAAVVVVAALSDGLLVCALADREVGGLSVLAAGIDRDKAARFRPCRAGAGAAVLAVAAATATGAGDGVALALPDTGVVIGHLLGLLAGDGVPAELHSVVILCFQLRGPRGRLRKS